MALTPEQILNKHFQTTQFRKGYDERDVDDFLDEIVAEMRTVASQRDDFKQQLNDCRAGRGLTPVRDDVAVRDAGATQAIATPVDARATEAEQARMADLKAKVAAAQAQEQDLTTRLTTLQADVTNAEHALRDRQGAVDKSVQERLDTAEGTARSATQAQQAAAARIVELGRAVQTSEEQVSAAQQQSARLQQALEEAQAQAAEAQQRATAAEQQATAATAPAVAQDEDSTNTGVMRAVAAGSAAGGGSAAALIELAQRLHDEHVGQGEAKRSELVAEGQRRHDELVSTAQSKHDELVGSAQSRHDDLVGSGQSQHDELLSTAQARHDELISTAQQQHDHLMSEATSKHEQLITEGRERSTGMVAEAQQRKAAVLGELEGEKSRLQKQIDELRGFERNYRSQLKSYLQGQLEELDTTGLSKNEKTAQAGQ